MAVLTERQSCNKTQSLSWDAQPKEDLFGILHHFIASRVIQDPERFTPAVRRVWIRFTDKGVTRRPRSLVFTARALGLFMTQSAEPMQLRRHDIDSHFDAALAVDSPASGSDIRLIERPKSLEEPMSQEDGIGMQ